MVQLIAFIIFIVSVGALTFILYKKIPVLVKLPQNGRNVIKENEFVAEITNRIKNFYFHFFEKQMLLHKLLSKSRIWVLKIERRIDNLLHGIRKNAQELDKKNGNKK